VKKICERMKKNETIIGHKIGSGVGSELVSDQSQNGAECEKKWDHNRSQKTQSEASCVRVWERESVRIIIYIYTIIYEKCIQAIHVSHERRQLHIHQQQNKQTQPHKQSKEQRKYCLYIYKYCHYIL